MTVTITVSVIRVDEYTVEFSNGVGLPKDWCLDAKVGQLWEITFDELGGLPGSEIQSVRLIS